MSRRMRIASIGGGPAGLYFVILLKQLDPAAEIAVFERSRCEAALAWGVVSSVEWLSNFEAAEPPPSAEIRRHFAYWGDIETHFGGAMVRSTGHGFCGLARKKL